MSTWFIILYITAGVLAWAIADVERFSEVLGYAAGAFVLVMTWPVWVSARTADRIAARLRD